MTQISSASFDEWVPQPQDLVHVFLYGFWRNATVIRRIGARTLVDYRRSSSPGRITNWVEDKQIHRATIIAPERCKQCKGGTP